VATGSSSDPDDVARLLVSLASSRPPTLGSGRLVCVDGPAGSGKTTLGEALARLLTGAQLVHGDDLMEGWRGLDAVGRQLAALVAELRVGGPAAYRRFNWHLGHYDRTVPVPASDWLVVEGVGTGAPAIAEATTVLVWVEAPDELRLERGLTRDGAEMQDHWRQFVLDERELFARDRTRERADVVVDGTGRTPPVVR
jgi:uridine kinase